jgi:O-antigen/teichoic acid export membrane protein
LIFAVLAPLILGLFGTYFIAAKSVFYVLLGVPILMALCGPAQQLLSLIERPIILTFLVCFSLSILCVGVIIGSVHGGVLGAALGVLMAWFFWTLGGAILAYKCTGLHTSVLGAMKRNKS